MSVSATPYALQNGSHSADLFRQAVSSLVPPGGGLVSPGDLAVTQTGTASMNVVFGVGRAWVPGTNVGNVSGGNFSKQAMYFALNDAAFTASVATANATNPRIDVAYLAIQDSQYAGTTNTAVLGIATGVPTAGASYPANAPTIPANAISLAWINVTANAASITSSNITAILQPVINPVTHAHAEYSYSTATNIASGSAPWGPGALTLDNTKSTDTGFTTPSTDTITFRDAGIYALNFTANMNSTASARSWLEFWDGTNFYARTPIPIGEIGVSVALPNFRCAAGATIKMAAFFNTTANANTWGYSGRVTVTRIG